MLLPECWVAVAASAASTRAAAVESPRPSTSMCMPGPCPVTVDGQSASLILKVVALDLSHPLLVLCSKTCGTDSGNIRGQTHDKRCEFALLVTSPI